MEPFEIIESDQKVVRCDGGKGNLGHPAVYLNMGEHDHIECPYCSRRYILSAHGKKHGGGGH